MSEYSTTGASTSAQLRQAQAAFAASQADLTRAQDRLVEERGDHGMTRVLLAAAERERDEERDRHRVLWGLERDACVQLRRRLIAAEGERELVEAELASAQAEIALLRTRLHPEETTDA